MRRVRIFFAMITVLAVVFVVPGEHRGADDFTVSIGRCDQLPVVPVKVNGRDYRFLLDTAATTILNSRSFSGGRQTRREVSSWRGLAIVKGNLVKVKELVLGTKKLKPGWLPALDISAIGKACGGRIDGILGIDLLRDFGAVVDLSQLVLHLPGTQLPSLQEEAEQHQRTCREAFNQGDVATLESCFDSNSLLISAGHRVRGAKDILRYLNKQHFRGEGRSEMKFFDKRAGLVGNTYWHAYRYQFSSEGELVEGEGLSICRRGKEGWRLLVMQNMPSR